MKLLYPDAAEQTFQIPRDSLGWFTDGMVRVADYFERIPITKTVAQLSDGRIIEYTAEEEKADKHLRKRSATQPPPLWFVKRPSRRGKFDGARLMEHKSSRGPSYTIGNVYLLSESQDDISISREDRNINPSFGTPRTANGRITFSPPMPSSVRPLFPRPGIS